MKINLQPTLVEGHICLIPLQESDFEAVYAAASDPKVWEQHPNRDRWQRAVFRNFFEGALASGGAFKVVDMQTNEVNGSTRFYDYDVEQNSILIGYTFYSVNRWGTGVNHQVKGMMLDYIFNYVNKVYFHIGAENHRSLISIGRLGAEKVREVEVAYYGESPKVNCEFVIKKEDWRAGY